MKTYRAARVSWNGDEYLGDAYKAPLKADVFINGSVCAINACRTGHSSVRVDRILGASVKEIGKAVEVSGKSEYLANVGLHPDDQTVTIRVEGGVCPTC